MKYFFTFISFLFLALTLQAQLIMEEISYVPSPSGYYNNLVVKGDVKINKFESNPFSIQAYSSILTLKVKNDHNLYIQSLDIKKANGSAYLRESDNDISASITEPNPARGTQATEPIHFYLYGGTLSANGTAGSPNMSIGSMSLPSITDLSVQTRFINQEGTDYMNVQTLYILGMDVPRCNGEYRWQRVRVGTGTGNTNIYTVLTCSNGTGVQSDSPAAPEQYD